MRIYDRWGEQVYAGEDLEINNTSSHGWDGIFRGQKAMAGVYVFHAEVIVRRIGREGGCEGRVYAYWSRRINKGSDTGAD